MLSILIPNFNLDVTSLLKDLDELAVREGLVFEIILGEDGSTEEVFQRHCKLLPSDHLTIHREEKQVGRARIRNLLSEKAKYPILLFIDSDARVENISFLKNYIEKIGQARVIVGGTAYKENPPSDPNKQLRWKYGKAREERKAALRNKKPYASFSSFNFLIEKKLFLEIKFNEEIDNYGHEDTYLGYQLKKRHISILHIDNYFIHTGLESSDCFLRKTRKGVKGLWELYSRTGFDADFRRDILLLKRMDIIKKAKMRKILSWKYNIFKKSLESNLLGKKPSIKFFQLYKLGYLCTIADK